MLKVSIVTVLTFSSFAGAWFSGNLIVKTEANCSAVFSLNQTPNVLSIGARTYRCPGKDPVTLPAMSFEVVDYAVLLEGKSVGASTEQIIKISNWNEFSPSQFSFVIYPVPGTGGESRGEIWDNYKSANQEAVGFNGSVSAE